MKVLYKITYKCLFFSVLFQNSMSESRNNMKRYSIKTFTNFIYFLFIVIIISYVYVQGYTHTTCRGQRTTGQSQFSPFTL